MDGADIARLGVVEARDPRALLLLFESGADIAPLDHADPAAAPLVARVNHGRWIAPCDCGATGLPSPGCVVWTSQPWGWCVRCGNAATGGRWRPIALPAPAERAAIEALLAVRADAATRNWLPGETVADLAAENAAHGIGED